MKPIVTVLIAAVTVNCLLTAINGNAGSDMLAVPYIDMLLPPLEDMQDISKEVPAKINATTNSTSVTTTTNPITDAGNNILPELSIEALLPPLFEAKTEEGKTETKATQKLTTTQRPSTTEITTTTQNLATRLTTTQRSTTTQRPTTTQRTNPTTARFTATIAKTSVINTTTLKPLNAKVPELSLDSLLPPLHDTNTFDAKEEQITTTTLKPLKVTTKSYYQQQITNLRPENNVYAKSNEKTQQQTKHLQATTSDNKVKKYYNKETAATARGKVKHIAESQIKPKQVYVPYSPQQKVNNDAMTQEHVAKHVAINSKHDKKQYNYSFDLYLGSTTARPTKSGLPTITPFPHRLGR